MPLIASTEVLSHCYKKDYVEDNYKVVSRSNAFKAVFESGSTSSTNLDYVYKVLSRFSSKPNFEAYVESDKLYMKSRSSGKFIEAKKSTAKTVCKSYAAVAIVPELLAKVNAIRNKVQADKEAKNQAIAIAKAKRDAGIKAKEAERIAKLKAVNELISVRRAEEKAIKDAKDLLIKDLKAEQSIFFVEVNRIDNIFASHAPRKVQVIISQKLENGTMVGTINGTLAGVQDFHGIINNAGVYQLEVVKLDNTISRKLNNGFTQTVPVYAVSTKGEQDFIKWKQSLEAIELADEYNNAKTSATKLQNEIDKIRQNLN